MSFTISVSPNGNIGLTENGDGIKISHPGEEYEIDLDTYDYLREDLTRWSEYEIIDGKVVKRGNNG